MYKFNKLWGVDGPHISEFSSEGSDSYLTYIDNRNRMGMGWQYYYNKVNYVRNSYGHRNESMPENFNNGLLFIGCSITEGISVQLEDTFPYVVSQQYDIDYYNLGLGAASIDLTATNLSLWLKYFNKPRCVIIQWPEYNRHVVSENGTYTIGPWLHDTKQYSGRVREDYKTIITTDYLEMYGNTLKNITYNMLDSHRIPYLEVHPICQDYGRDLKHPGSMSHIRMAVKIIEQLRPIM